MKPSSRFINGGFMFLYNLGKEEMSYKNEIPNCFSDVFALSLNKINKKIFLLLIVTKITNK